MDKETQEIIDACRQVWPDAFVIPLSQGPYGEPTMTGKEITREDWPLFNLHDYLERVSTR
jgi:hypothetical protein